MRRRIEEPFLTAAGGGGYAVPAAGERVLVPAFRRRVAPSLPLVASWFYGVKGSGRWVRGGCRRVQGPPEFLSVRTCAVLAPCLREAQSCLVAAWCRGGCCPRCPAPGDLVLLLLALRAPYSPAVFLAAHHPSGECGPSLSWTPRWAEAAVTRTGPCGRRCAVTAGRISPGASASRDHRQYGATYGTTLGENGRHRGPYPWCRPVI